MKPYQKGTKPRHSYFTVHHATVGTSQEASGSRSSTLSPTTSSSATAQEPSRRKKQEECIQKALQSVSVSFMTTTPARTGRAALSAKPHAGVARRRSCVTCGENKNCAHVGVCGQLWPPDKAPRVGGRVAVYAPASASVRGHGAAASEPRGRCTTQCLSLIHI